MQGFLHRIEKLSQRLQGKGWGSHTVDREIGHAARLLGGEVSRCIDIGGNKGLYAEGLRRAFPTAGITVFEPSNTNLSILRDMFAGDDRVTIEPFAVSDRAGTAQLFSDTPGSGLGSLSRRDLDHMGIEFDTEEAVRTIRFEEYWRDRLDSAGLDFVKLDIEGHELAALEGFGRAIDHSRVIQFEFGGCNIDTRTYFKDFWTFFGDHGFALYRMTPLGLAPVRRYRERDEFFSTTNYLAAR